MATPPTLPCPPGQPENPVSLRGMAFWALVLAASLGLLAGGMMFETGVSERVTVGGTCAAVAAVFVFLAAFLGPLRPWLFTPVIWVGLVLVWLLVPVAGLEAYMHAEGISPESTYAVSGWKWTFLFCLTGAAAALRLLVLRQELIRKKPFFADWT